MSLPAIQIQPVNIGAVPDDGTGDKLRLGLEKLNSNIASLAEVLAAILSGADPEIVTFKTIAQLIYGFNATVTALPAPAAVQKQITDAVAATIATLPTAAQIQQQINSATAAAVAGVPTAASIQAQITDAINAAVASLDISNFYNKAAIDQKLSDFKGGADAAHDTLGELATLIDANASAIALRALKDSPELTGTPKAPTATLGTNSTQIATMAALAAGLLDLKTFITNGAGEALDQFNEFATAIGNDPNFSATILDGLAKRIRYDAAQSLTSAQITRALTNLGGTTVGRALIIAASQEAGRQAIGAPAADGGAHTGATTCEALSVNGRRVYGPQTVSQSGNNGVAIGTAAANFLAFNFTATGTSLLAVAKGTANSANTTACEVIYTLRLIDVTGGNTVVSSDDCVSTTNTIGPGNAPGSLGIVATGLTVGRTYQLQLRIYTNSSGASLKSNSLSIAGINL